MVMTWLTWALIVLGLLVGVLAATGRIARPRRGRSKEAPVSYTHLTLPTTSRV